MLHGLPLLPNDYGNHQRALEEGGHLAIVEWIVSIFPRLLTVGERQPEQTTAMASDALIAIKAAHYGHMDILRWFHERLDKTLWTQERKEKILYGAVEASQLDVVRYLHEVCGIRPLATRFPNFAEAASVDFVSYMLDMVEPGDVGKSWILAMAAAGASRDVVEYLVLKRGFWSPIAFTFAALRMARSRPGSAKTHVQMSLRMANVQMCRFLYAHAHVRARESGMPLETQIEFDRVSTLDVAKRGNHETARWLAECVMEADTGKTLIPLFPDDIDIYDFDRTTDAHESIVACLRARPAQCRGVAWLPKWAVRANCSEAFSLLVDMDHPNLDEGVFWIPRDSRFGHKLLATKGADFNFRTANHRDVFAWAAMVGVVSVLTATEKEGHRCGPTLIEYSIEIASKNGHVDVLEWMYTRALLLLQAVVRTEANVVQLVQRVTKHSRVDCLRWLLVTFDVPTDVIAETVRSAASQRDVRIVRMLTDCYAPELFALSTDDRRRIRACLLG